MSEEVQEYKAKNELVVSERIEVSGADELDRSDILMPRLRVRQPTSKFGEPGDAGKLYNNLSELFADSVEAVVLRVSKGRVMWPEGFNSDNEPMCASDDAKMPRQGDGLSDRQEGPCVSCPYAQWGDEGQPPACSLVYTYLIANRDDDDMPAMISAMRTSAKAAKKLNSLIKMYGIKKAVSIETELMKGDQGQWYELRFKVKGALEPVEIQKYAGMMRSLAEVDMTVDTENTANDLEESDFAPTDDEPAF